MNAPNLEHLASIVAWLAFALGVVFGAVAQRVDFCTMGAISDIVQMGDWRRMRMWLLAIAVAIVGANGLEAMGVIDLSKSIYTASRTTWLSSIVGGVLFGFGMTLASGCGSKTLIRLGGGNLKSAVVLMALAISAYMTLKGLFGIWRVEALDVVRFDTSVLGAGRSDLGSIVGALVGTGPWTRLFVASAVAIALAAFVFASREFRRDRKLVLGSIVIGAVIVAGWYVTAHIGYVAENPQTLEESFVATNSGRAESFSFVSPVAYLLELLLLWSDQSKIVTFGIAAVIGVAAGSAAMAVAMRRFRWESFSSTEDLVNHLVGGVLMGFGGVTALGCTIGQGLTGISTLAVGSILAFVSIIAGCVLALRFQYWRLDLIPEHASVPSQGA